MSFDSSSSFFSRNRNHRTTQSSRSNSRERSTTVTTQSIYSNMSDSESNQQEDIQRLQEKLQGFTVQKSRKIPQKLQTERENLPAYQKRNEIIQIIETNQVTIINGDTGCGKSTQVTQYLLEDARRKGEHIKIACTQPRRIAAISLAERVSEEVGCQLGTIVGYQIGMERMCDNETNIVYLTPGVLLQQLMRREGRNMYTHIIIDEAHERDLDTEFCLMLLRKFIARTHIRLIIMSAMMDVDVIQDHFMLKSNPDIHSNLESVLCDLADQENMSQFDTSRLTIVCIGAFTGINNSDDYKKLTTENFIKRMAYIEK